MKRFLVTLVMVGIWVFSYACSNVKPDPENNSNSETTIEAVANDSGMDSGGHDNSPPDIQAVDNHIADTSSESPQEILPDKTSEVSHEQIPDIKISDEKNVEVKVDTHISEQKRDTIISQNGLLIIKRDSKLSSALNLLALTSGNEFLLYLISAKKENADLIGAKIWIGDITGKLPFSQAGQAIKKVYAYLDNKLIGTSFFSASGIAIFNFTNARINKGKESVLSFKLDVNNASSFSSGETIYAGLACNNANNDGSCWGKKSSYAVDVNGVSSGVKLKNINFTGDINGSTEKPSKLTFVHSKVTVSLNAASVSTRNFGQNYAEGIRIDLKVDGKAVTIKNIVLTGVTTCTTLAAGHAFWKSADETITYFSWKSLVAFLKFDVKNASVVTKLKIAGGSTKSIKFIFNSSSCRFPVSKFVWQAIVDEIEFTEDGSSTTRKQALAVRGPVHQN